MNKVLFREVYVGLMLIDESGTTLRRKYMNITMLGTGNALVTECYNTCFILQEDNEYFLVDGGGGSTILHQLKYAGIDWKNVRNIFVTHKHIDHITGILWMIRMICQYMKQGEYEGEATIYAHDEVINLLRDLAEKLLQKKEIDFIGKRLHLVAVEDGESINILNKKHNKNLIIR